MTSTAEVSKAVMKLCDGMTAALGAYQAYAVQRGGVDIETTIDGKSRSIMSHREGMPRDWIAYLSVLSGLCWRHPTLMGGVIDVFAGVELEGDNPSFEAMLCAAEDLLIIAEHYGAQALE